MAWLDGERIGREALARVQGPEPDPWCVPEKGLLATEVPLRTDVGLQQPEILEARLGLRQLKRGVIAARGVIIANVLYAYFRGLGSWVFYSRDRNHYAVMARAGRYLPSYYSYANMMQAVESLEQAGPIEHERTLPSPTAQYRSRLRASPLLVALCEGSRPKFVCEPREVIILRDASGGLVPYSDSDFIYSMRRDVLEQNEFLADLDIQVEHPYAVYDQHGFLHVHGNWLDPGRRAYRRVFNNGSWRLGGRWYGTFWQSLPKPVRQRLIINGEPGIEGDFRTCHPRLLCARSGLDLPFHDEHFDFYEIPRMDRSQIKFAFQVMVNAPTERKAEAAIAAELSDDQRARSLMVAVQKSYPGLERFWCSGMGLRLQTKRSDIPVLSVHDSFIVPRGAESLLKQIMEEAMERACRHAAKS